MNNTLAGITNYASLATAALRREILRGDASGRGVLTGVLADVTRISDAATSAGLMNPPRVNVAATFHSRRRPAAVPRAALRTARALSDETAGGAPTRFPRTVLLVDDDPSVRESAARLLQLEGYAVIEAADTGDALAKSAAHAGRIDLLLTDFAMPGSGGGDLRAAIALGRPDTKVLFMTGYGHRAFVRRGLLTDRANVLHKPFSAGDLYSKVAQILRTP